MLLGLGLGLVILAGLAAFWFLTKDGGESVTSDEAASGESIADAPLDASPATDTALDTLTSEDDPAGPETTNPPQVSFDEAAVGPVAAGQEYTVGVNGGPTDAATYQLFIDGEPSAEPAPTLAPVVFEPGRHLLEIAVSSPSAGEVSTTPVVVYAVGEIPGGVTYRANLSSVNVQTEGWAEAVRQFDDFSQAHADLQLMPSDWFPDLVPGYWNLFVGGFGTDAEAKAYCTAAGLEIPVDCFSQQVNADTVASG